MKRIVLVFAAVVLLGSAAFGQEDHLGKVILDLR